jgi:hypothetical protein
MSQLSVSDKIQLLQNLLADPDDWVSAELLRLNRLLENRDDDSNASGSERSLAHQRLNNSEAITLAQNPTE